MNLNPYDKDGRLNWKFYLYGGLFVAGTYMATDYLIKRHIENQKIDEAAQKIQRMFDRMEKSEVKLTPELERMLDTMERK